MKNAFDITRRNVMFGVGTIIAANGFGTGAIASLSGEIQAPETSNSHLPLSADFKPIVGKICRMKTIDGDVCSAKLVRIDSIRKRTGMPSHIRSEAFNLVFEPIDFNADFKDQNMVVYYPRLGNLDGYAEPIHRVGKPAKEFEIVFG